MTTDLIVKDLDTNEKMLSIITKTTEVGFRVIDENKLAMISAAMPEVDRALSVFSKTNSQHAASLMTLNMLDSGPYRVLRQILAQINTKRAALKEAMYNKALNEVKIDKYRKELEAALENDDMLKNRELTVETTKLEIDINDSVVYIENCLKEIGAYVQRYNEIKESHNIPDNWDEEDFEAGEIKHHIESMFKLAISDLKMNGRLNCATMEYFTQFGIEPLLAEVYAANFIKVVSEGISKGEMVAIDMRYKFYDEMYDLFKDEYKRALNRLGLKSATYDEYLLREVK